MHCGNLQCSPMRLRNGVGSTARASFVMPLTNEFVRMCLQVQGELPWKDAKENLGKSRLTTVFHGFGMLWHRQGAPKTASGHLFDFVAPAESSKTASGPIAQ